MNEIVHGLSIHLVGWFGKLNEVKQISITMITFFLFFLAKISKILKQLNKLGLQWSLLVCLKETSQFQDIKSVVTFIFPVACC